MTTTHSGEIVGSHSWPQVTFELPLFVLSKQLAERHFELFLSCLLPLNGLLLRARRLLLSRSSNCCPVLLRAPIHLRLTEMTKRFIRKFDVDPLAAECESQSEKKIGRSMLYKEVEDQLHRSINLEFLRNAVETDENTAECRGITAFTHSIGEIHVDRDTLRRHAINKELDDLTRFRNADESLVV